VPLAQLAECEAFVRRLTERMSTGGRHDAAGSGLARLLHGWSRFFMKESRMSRFTGWARKWGVVAAAVAGLAMPAMAQDFKVAMSSPPTSMDPHFQNITTNANVIEHMFEPLVMRSADGKLAPGLASSWTNINTTHLGLQDPRRRQVQRRQPGHGRGRHLLARPPGQHQEQPGELHAVHPLDHRQARRGRADGAPDHRRGHAAAAG
jgi:hypothetical protein